MKVVILAGGYGTRISEESLLKPKPMIEIGDRPILWHIMKAYSYYGFHDFIICAGYKQHVIKEWFADFYLHNTDVTFDLENNHMTVHNSHSEAWTVTVVDTGLNTMTGGRLKRIRSYIGDQTFLLTYGDGLCDVDIGCVARFHKEQGKLATITAIQPGGRFGALKIRDHLIEHFAEKKKEDGGWVNGGYMVLEPAVMDYIAGDDTTLEAEPLERLSLEGQLAAYKHSGFWQCMDTMKDKLYLEQLITEGNAPWMVWESGKGGGRHQPCRREYAQGNCIRRWRVYRQRLGKRIGGKRNNGGCTGAQRAAGRHRGPSACNLASVFYGAYAAAGRAARGAGF